mmetsp:Transcript_15217/g.34317  ORF Transcript_15217/g.34317 Transcript_15217/m.34317 type:complete len:236 (-) Transcript_15217:683-1390(-)
MNYCPQPTLRWTDRASTTTSRCPSRSAPTLSSCSRRPRTGLVRLRGKTTGAAGPPHPESMTRRCTRVLACSSTTPTWSRRLRPPRLPHRCRCSGASPGTCNSSRCCDSHSGPGAIPPPRQSRRYCGSRGPPSPWPGRTLDCRSSPRTPPAPGSCSSSWRRSSTGRGCSPPRGFRCVCSPRPCPRASSSVPPSRRLWPSRPGRSRPRVPSPVRTPRASPSAARSSCGSAPRCRPGP